ncbi:phage/plasmid primase, P4 family [Janthinobacterium sp. SUN100]|uniref:DNA primase family protein n=1 Tax=Janthinobacterium sp. SUN100 TaxID=3004101 RepID=UPI0025B077C4|nr:phage/plasmid primase, P4 family [Janthinobacterium sp. SUN100]MDN2702042.1 phage/plasmid primase, P4 family [Janthinobacterium sp. SUN100]
MNARFEPHLYATTLSASDNYAVDGGLIHTWTGNHWSVTSDDIACKQAYRWIATSEPRDATAENAKKAVNSAKLWLPDVVKESADIVIPCMNGYVQVKNSKVELTSPDKSLGLKHSLICEFQPDFGPATQFEKFLEMILPDTAVRSRVQEYIGYTLTSDARYQKAQLWLGSGANGKGVLANIVQKLHEKTAAIRLDSLDGFSLSVLIGASLIYVDEVPKARINEQILKSLIAGEKIQIDRKYETPLSTHIRGKWLVLGNHLPAITDHSIGFWRRWDIIPFSVTVKESERDPLLADNIIRTEMPGVLNWALAGLLRLQKRGAFEVTLPLAMQSILSDAKRETNSVQAWFEENDIIASHSLQSTKDEIYEHYREWCLRNGMASMASPRFWQTIRGIVSLDEGRRREGSQQVRYCNLLLPNSRQRNSGLAIVGG